MHVFQTAIQHSRTAVSEIVTKFKFRANFRSGQTTVLQPPRQSRNGCGRSPDDPGTLSLGSRAILASCNSHRNEQEPAYNAVSSSLYTSMVSRVKPEVKVDLIVT